MAGLELVVENSIPGSVLFFGASTATLVVLWRRRSSAGPLRYDSAESYLQTLDLS
jgi:hypothetical protein